MGFLEGGPPPVTKTEVYKWPISPACVSEHNAGPVFLTILSIRNTNYWSMGQGSLPFCRRILATSRLAEVLAPRRAVDVRHQDLAARVELVRKLVPSRLHRLAMPSPGREELDEGGLARLEDLWVRWRDRVNFWRCLLHGAQFCSAELREDERTN